MIRKLSISAVITIVIIIGLFYSFSPGSEEQRDIRQDMREFFQSEDEYNIYLKNKITFQGVKLDFITVKPGDNFWKIAREHNVNIDTLIGVNLFWRDLRARTNQVVIVPSESGTIEFINDTGQLEYLARDHGVELNDMIVQDLPVFYSLSRLINRDRKPIAVFVKDGRPSTENMTASLAGRYRQRELFRSPLGGRLSSFFGKRKHPIYNKIKFHDGLDIAAPYGTLIGAARSGVVTSAGWNGGYGKAVTIDHGDGYRTMYGHMSVIYAKPGQQVKAGRIIGRVGSTGLSTGPHLHFTLWHKGKLINPMDILW